MSDVLRYAAFTSDPSGGNPAGVVLDASDLDDAAMLRIAADLGYSESAFLTPRGGPRQYRARYFSPRAEVAFCGHATIASAVALADQQGPGPLTLQTNPGEVPVHTARIDGLTTASLTSVPTSSTPAPPELLNGALQALGWDAAALDTAYPPHVAFGGAYHLMLAADSRERLANLEYDFDSLADLMRAHNLTTVDLFWPELGSDIIHTRNPFPIGGVVEDPATGAAAAALGGYLAALGRVTAPRRLTLHQGDDMGRPSRLLVDVTPGDPRVIVTGTAVPLT